MPIFDHTAPPDIIALSETWFTNETTEDLQHYKGYHVTRPSGRGGAITLFVRDSIDSSAVEQTSFQSPTIEINTVKILIESQEYYIIGIYRPHSDTIPNFIAALRRVLETFPNKKVILTGDININLLNIQNNSIVLNIRN